MTIEITINTSKLDGLCDAKAPLYVGSSGNVMRASLELAFDGQCSISLASSWSGTSSNVWHGLTRAWALPVYVKGYVLEKLLTDSKFIELLQRVHDGHDYCWDGGNMVGTLSEDAQEASAKIQDLIARLCRHEGTYWAVICASDSIAQSSIEDVWHAGQSLADAAQALMDGNEYANILVEGGEDALEAALVKRLEDRIRRDESFEPTPEQLAALGGR